MGGRRRHGEEEAIGGRPNLRNQTEPDIPPHLLAAACDHVEGGEDSECAVWGITDCFFSYRFNFNVTTSISLTW